jgi:hypothetical protein
MADTDSGWRVVGRALERVFVVASIRPGVCFLGRYSNSWSVLSDSIFDRRVRTPIYNINRSVLATV